MSNVTVNSNGKNIEVISIEDLGDKKRIFLGDVDSDIILRCLNGIKVQIGNKIIDSGFSYEQNDNTLTTGSSVKQYSNIEDNFTSIEGSLVDGDMIYDVVKKRLYIYSGNSLVRLTNVSDNKQYLSFLDNQILSGDEKILLLRNAGIAVSTLKELTSIENSDSYTNMIVYVSEEKQHYCLTGSNSRSLSSWTLLYLSAVNGGVVNGAVVVDPLRVSDKKSALHVNGYYNSDYVSNISETQSIFSIGDSNLNKGIATWCHSDGNVYIQGLDPNYDTGITFITRTGEINNHLLTLKGQKVGINTDVKPNYNNAIGGKTVFEDKVFLKDNLSSELYAGGFAGYGMRLGRDDYGQWSLDIDNLTVRQRMSVYELVVNQIKATNGSLWVSDGAKIKTCTKYTDINIYIKAKYAGAYKEIAPNAYDIIPIEERPPYALIYNPTTGKNALEGFKMGYGFGDSYLRIINNVATYVNPTYNTYNLVNGSYVTIPPTHRLDSSGEFIADTNGEYIIADTVSVYGITFDDLPPFFEGDLVRMQMWDQNLNRLRFARCQVGKQRNTSTEGSKPELLVYVFNSDDLVPELSLVRIGNNKDNIMSEFTIKGVSVILEKERGFNIPLSTWVRDIKITQAEPNRLGAIYLTAADSGAPYIDIIDRVESHNAFNPFRGNVEPDKDVVEVMQSRLKVRLGKLANLVDMDMGLDGGTWQQYLYGIYTDSGFFKGNIVAMAGKIGDIFLKGGVLFTYNNGHNHTPIDFEYENSNNQTTSSGKINTNWLFGKQIAGMVLDGKKSRFSLGNRLSFENNTLIIGEVDGIGDLKTVINNIAGGVDVAFLNALKGNFTSITEGLISSSVIRLGSITKDSQGNVTGWTDRCGMSGLDDAGENSVRFWAGETLANRNTAPFRIYQNGSFVSTKGSIGGFVITDSEIKSSNNLINLNSNGSVHFEKGRIGTWDISNYSISHEIVKSIPYTGQVITTFMGLFAQNNEAAFFAGSSYGGDSGAYQDSPFYVNNEGYAKITKGNIGGFTIEGDKLSSGSLLLDTFNNVLKFSENTPSGFVQASLGTYLIPNLNTPVRSVSSFINRAQGCGIYAQGTKNTSIQEDGRVAIMGDGAIVSNVGCIGYGWSYLRPNSDSVGINMYLDQGTTFITDSLVPDGKLWLINPQAVENGLRLYHDNWEGWAVEILILCSPFAQYKTIVETYNYGGFFKGYDGQNIQSISLGPGDSLKILLVNYTPTKYYAQILQHNH